MKEYKIYPKSGFDYIEFEKLTAIFFDLDLARDYVSYQITLGRDFVITCNGAVIEDEL